MTGVLLSAASAGCARVRAWACGLDTHAGGPPVVRTGNEETNPMLAINERIGFRQRPAWL